MWAYAYDHYIDEYDYFYICGDDMYVVVDNLRAYLDGPDVRSLLDGYLDPLTMAYDAAKARGWLTNATGRPRPLVLGLPLFLGNRPFPSRGSGYVLNRAALQLLGEVGLPSFRAHDVTSQEDVCIGDFFASQGIHCAMFLDKTGARKFGAWMERYWQRRFKIPIKYGLDAVAEQRISMHLKGSRGGKSALPYVIRHYDAVLWGLCNSTTL
uniref:Hexosyltransferase n=1 Tax=Odontella aurita TaxID=265563 RepID=A0A7S4M799_9STRA|mmetsp:Transcript_13079/g.38452  ORF Transcript_13079/g.38452 Transcript_13079/m.38452 type:complete len:210 (+) Transcript_13079:444-1073(+)